MGNEPEIVRRPETPYVAITTWARMGNVGTVVPPLTREVADWLTAGGAQPVGACCGSTT